MNPQISTKSSPLRTLDSNDGSESQARRGGLFVHKMKMLIEVNVLSSTVVNKGNLSFKSLIAKGVVGAKWRPRKKFPVLF